MRNKRAPHPLFTQVIRRISPVVGESSRGYLRRLAREWLYPSPCFLLAMADVRESDVDREEYAEQIARSLKLTADQWRSLSYSRIACASAKETMRLRTETIRYGDLTFRSPRICPMCLRERLIEWQVWEFCAVTACSQHRCRLIDACDHCGRKIQRRQPDVQLCPCGRDLREVNPASADPPTLFLCSLIEKAVNHPEAGDWMDASTVGFPRHLHDLRLPELLRLIRFLGSTHAGGVLLHDEVSVARADLGTAQLTVEAAARVLTDWPSRFRDLLKSNLPPMDGSGRAATIASSYRSFYDRMYADFSSPAFSFLTSVFEAFMAEHWLGNTRGTPSWLTRVSRVNYRWCSLKYARRKVKHEDIESLIHSGEIEGFIVADGTRSHGRVNIKSLGDFIRRQKPVIPMSEAMIALGLSRAKIATLVDSGTIGMTNDGLIREDIERIASAFHRYQLPIMPQWDNSRQVSLRDAARTILTYPGSLENVLAAVISGELAPIARCDTISGIGGYILDRLDVELRGQIADRSDDLGPCLNVAQVARFLKIEESRVMALIESRQIPVARVCNGKTGARRMMKFSEVQKFANQYESAGAIAKRIGMSAKGLIGRLRERDLPLLEIPFGKVGNHAIFVPKNMSTMIQVPLSRSLENLEQNHLTSRAA